MVCKLPSKIRGQARAGMFLCDAKIVICKRVGSLCVAKAVKYMRAGFLCKLSNIRVDSPCGV